VVADEAGIDGGFPALVIVRTLHVVTALYFGLYEDPRQRKCAYSKDRFK
jgi:hypothetical protein